MSRLIEHAQYEQLMELRKQCIEALAAGNNRAMLQGVGKVQGFLLGLHAAGEIDADDMTSLELDTFAPLDFLANAKKAGISPSCFAQTSGVPS